MTLRGAGDARTPFVFLAVNVVLDIALNPLFIFGWGPVPRMGIAGSATATLIAQVITSGGADRLSVPQQAFPAASIAAKAATCASIARSCARLFAKGIPMGLQMIVMSLSMLALISLVNSFGAHTTAAYGACFQLWNYIQMPSIAIGMAASSMAAQNVGAGQWDRVHRVAHDRRRLTISCSPASLVAADLPVQSRRAESVPARPTAARSRSPSTSTQSWSGRSCSSASRSCSPAWCARPAR